MYNQRFDYFAGEGKNPHPISFKDCRAFFLYVGTLWQSCSRLKLVPRLRLDKIQDFGKKRKKQTKTKNKQTNKKQQQQNKNKKQKKQKKQERILKQI